MAVLFSAGYAAINPNVCCSVLLVFLLQPKPRPSDSCSTTSSGSSGTSDSCDLVPATRDKQAAYAAALARVRAAKQANHRDDCDNDSS
jgi:hypothetical protein